MATPVTLAIVYSTIVNGQIVKTWTERCDDNNPKEKFIKMVGYTWQVLRLDAFNTSCVGYSLIISHSEVGSVATDAFGHVAGLNFIFYRNSGINNKRILFNADFSKTPVINVNITKNDRLKLGDNVRFNESTERIFLGQNGLRRFPAGIFQNLSNLIKLDLRENLIKCLESDSFYGLKKIKNLSIKNNNLNYLLPNTFTHLKSLRKLVLSNNHLKWISGDQFTFWQKDDTTYPSIYVDGNDLIKLPRCLEQLPNFIYEPKTTRLQVTGERQAANIAADEICQGAAPYEYSANTCEAWSNLAAKGVPNTGESTTAAPNTGEPTTAAPNTGESTTAAPNTGEPTTSTPNTGEPTTAAPTTEEPNTAAPTTEEPNTAAPTTEETTTAAPTTEEPNTAAPTTEEPTTEGPNTAAPTTEETTTAAPTTEEPTTEETTTKETTTEEPTREAPTTEMPITETPPTAAPKTAAPKTAAPKTAAPKTAAPTTEEPSTKRPATGGFFKVSTENMTEIITTESPDLKQEKSKDLSVWGFIIILVGLPVVYLIYDHFRQSTLPASSTETEVEPQPDILQQNDVELGIDDSTNNKEESEPPIRATTPPNNLAARKTPKMPATQTRGAKLQSRASKDQRVKPPKSMTR